MPTEFKVGDLIKVRPGEDYSGFSVRSRDLTQSYRVNHDSVLLVVEVYAGHWPPEGDQILYKCLPVGSEINVYVPQADIHHFMHTNE
mgnify:CR=1 FL=1|jgi:mannose-6-phosphate isomerase-like protein (cupin superfamily)